MTLFEKEKLALGTGSGKLAIFVVKIRSVTPSKQHTIYYHSLKKKPDRLMLYCLFISLLFKKE